MTQVSASREKPIVVKIGGRAAEDDVLIASLAEELKILADRGERILLIHGGGVTISSLQDAYGIAPRFVDGLRQTPPEEMPLVDMALSGAVNKRLVRVLTRTGIPAWGLSGVDGGLIQGKVIGGSAEANRTGTPTNIEIRPIITLWSAGYVPVLAPPASDARGRGLNINADEAALAVAAALEAGRLVFISDVPGVMEKDDVLPALTPGLIEEKISSGVIAGGMIPKTRSAAGALSRGVGAVIIGDYAGTGNLEDLLSGVRGTRIDTGGYHHGS